MRSRLKSNIKKNSLHIIIIIFALIVALLVFGTQLLIGFSTVLGMLNNSTDQKSEIHEVSYVAPPVLNPLPAATNIDNTSVSGSNTSTGVLIKLYVNGKYVNEISPNNDGEFVFSNIRLNKGENEIKAKSVSSNGDTSAYSNLLKIKYIGTEPTLEISHPQNDQTFRKNESPIKIAGKSDPGVKVTVNDFWAISNDEGDFYYLYNLKDGDNNLIIIATDEAGGKTKKELKIKAE